MENSDEDCTPPNDHDSGDSGDNQDTLNPAKSDIADTFSLFKSYFDSQLKNLKRDISTESRKLQQESAKRKRTVEFIFKGNKKQFEFNESIGEKLDIAIALCDQGSQVQVVKAYLDDIRRDIKKRIKLIRLADKSEFGWDLVEEYLSDDVASDSDDAKKIRQAEERVIREKEKATNG